jgi:hypothetical protein
VEAGAAGVHPRLASVPRGEANIERDGGAVENGDGWDNRHLRNRAAPPSSSFSFTNDRYEFTDPSPWIPSHCSEENDPTC